MKAKLSLVTSATLVVCAVVITGLNVRQELFSRPRPAGPPQGVPVGNWRELLGEPQSNGADGIDLFVFADYTCRYCRQLEGALDSLQSALGPRVRVRHVHFPLLPAGTGFTAAMASECAATQQRGPAYHRLLYAHQGELGTLPWDSLAAHAGIPDAAAFHACVAEQRTAGIVRRDRSRGEALGINATPGILVGGRLYVGRRGFGELVSLVEQATPP